MTEAYRLGSLARDNNADLYQMMANVDANKHTTFQITLGNMYVVPGSHQLVITRLIFQSAGGSGEVRIGYGDNSKDDDAVEPTNAVYVIRDYFSPTADTIYEFSVIAKIPAGKYPFVKAVAQNCLVQIQGYEEGV